MDISSAFTGSTLCLMCVQLLSRVQLFVTPWTVTRQFMGFTRQEYWSGFPYPPPGDLPDPGIELASPVAPALAGRFFTIEPPGKPLMPLIPLLIGLHFYHLLGITEHCFTEFNVQFSF